MVPCGWGEGRGLGEEDGQVGRGYILRHMVSHWGASTMRTGTVFGPLLYSQYLQQCLARGRQKPFLGE